MNFDAWRHGLRARLYTRLRRWEAAIAAYRAALAAAPDDLKASTGLGYLLGLKGRYEEALPHLRRAVALAPKRADLWFNLGFALDKAGRRREAVAALEEATRLDPRLDRAWYGLALAHAGLGAHREAVRCLEEATRLQPMNGHAWYALGMAWHHCREPGQVSAVAKHLASFDPQMARQLITETGRADLAYLVEHLKDWRR